MDVYRAEMRLKLKDIAEKPTSLVQYQLSYSHPDIPTSTQRTEESWKKHSVPINVHQTDGNETAE